MTHRSLPEVPPWIMLLFGEKVEDSAGRVLRADYQILITDPTSGGP